MAKPAPKSPDIRKMQNDLMGTDVEDAIKRDICARCGGPATGFKDAVSAKEFTLTGFCQKCQDVVFAEPPDPNADPNAA